MGLNEDRTADCVHGRKIICGADEASDPRVLSCRELQVVFALRFENAKEGKKKNLYKL